MKITLDNEALRRVIENYVNGTLAQEGSTVSIENVNRKHSGNLFVTIAITEPEPNQARIATLQPGYIELDPVERVQPAAELEAPVATVAIEELVGEEPYTTFDIDWGRRAVPKYGALDALGLSGDGDKPGAVIAVLNEYEIDDGDAEQGITTGVFPEPAAQEHTPVDNVVKPPTDSLFD